MPDTPSAFPPPPPGSLPPPDYHPAPVAGPPIGYPQEWQQQAHLQPGVGMGGGAAGIMAQFQPPALWAIIVGLVTVIAPLFFGRVFFFLPIAAILTGVRAIMRGKLIGGIVGIVLGAIGGVLTLVGLLASR
jgi:hypothetical protein